MIGIFKMDRIKNYLEERYSDEEIGDILLVDGFEEAFVGVVESFGAAPKACYNYETILDILMVRDNMTYCEALEFFNFNIADAYVGEYTPAFIKLDIGEQKI
tara:strand:- start:821 stop:1126 length:306 start_codon:yes stop_codon:yes gene_type:complete